MTSSPEFAPGPLGATPANGADAWWYRRAELIAGALLVLHGVLAWVNRAITPGLFHDEAHYMLLSRSLRQWSYEDFFLLGSPVHSQYPPGVPALHALLSLLSGDRVGVLIAGTILCSVAALALFYDIVRRSAGTGLALVVLGLAAVNPEMHQFAGRPLSEAPYMMWSMLALWGIARQPGAVQRASAVSRDGLALAAAVCAALTRTVGVTLIGAIGLTWFLDRRWRNVLLLTGVVAATIGGWLLWTTFAPGKLAGRSYVADMIVSGPGGPKSPVALVASRVGKNVPRYLTRHLPKNLPQPTLAAITKRLPDGAGRARSVVTLFDRAVALVLLAGLATIGAIAAWPKARVAVLYLLLYSGLMAVWPYDNARFFVPLMPIVLWFVLGGAAWVASRRQWLRPLPLLVAAGIGAIAMARDVNLTRDSLRCPRAEAFTSPACSTESERGLFAAFDFIRSSVPDSAIVLNSVDTQLGYFTGRRSLFSQAADTSGPAALLSDLRTRGVEFALVTSFRPSHEQYVPLLIESCQGLEVMREFGADALLLRVARPNEIPSPRACSALRAYLQKYPLLW